ncbi:DUF533 domain-containing protein [Zwartia vadi]|uniref:DUF533 domain-containing protein n=1 Tax=Zwartia vadi TaxID=3058168 RepID=UPI0025B47C73|nr:DUF533 domain-containing protein [Zwartia vadi]MDN3986774.1 DUF533 domain-containing protein [Zwartia vadi]
MNAERAILSIAMFAAFADGVKDEREREHVKQFAEQLGSSSVELMGVYQDVLLNRISLNAAADALTNEGQRRYAYELAVCVCDSDGVRCDTENRFLMGLRQLLGLESDKLTAAAEKQADEIALSGALVPAIVTETHPVAQPVASAQPVNVAVDEIAQNKMILNYSIVNGALELLPQSWASVAIIPLQIKMVYRVGKAYGHELDQGHIREFLATVGVGLTSQYLEQFGRKLVGGLLGGLLGKTGKKMGGAATGMVMSFATTYALGQVAIRYYASGRQMSTDLLKQTFTELIEPAKNLQAQYLPQIQEKARTLDANSIMSMVKGTASPI